MGLHRAHSLVDRDISERPHEKAKDFDEVVQ